MIYKLHAVGTMSVHIPRWLYKTPLSNAPKKANTLKSLSKAIKHPGS